MRFWARLFPVAVVAMTAALCGGAWGELTPEKTKQAQALITQCGDKDFQVREAATQSLIEMGQIGRAHV
jgi:hypothetical protein